MAQQSGKWAAQNILRELHGEPHEPFVYKDKGIMAMIGRNAAVAEVGKHRHQVEGPVAFAAWLGVHAMLLSGVHSKTDAFLTWAWDYFDRDHAATIEATTAPRRRLGRPRRGHAAHRAGPAAARRLSASDMRPPRSTNTTCIFSMRGAPHVDPLLPMCVRREAVVGQGVTVKAEARIDLVERRRVRGP